MTDHMTQADLGAIRARSEAATPGPWEIMKAIGTCDRLEPCPYDKQYEDESCSKCDDWRWTQGAFIDTSLTLDCGNYDGMNDADAEFCTHAREDIPYLLSDVERLTAELTAYRQAEQDGTLAWAITEHELPTQRGWYMVTVASGVPVSPLYYSGAGYWWSGNLVQPPLAWLPNPEPYKPNDGPCAENTIGGPADDF